VEIMIRIPSQLDEDEGAPAPNADEDDAILEECLQDALGLFPGVLSAEAVEEHRRFLRAFILTHPAARALYDQIRYDRLRKQPATASSGPVAKDGALLDGQVEDVGDGTTGARR
jgi:hypothetical protein